MKNEQEKLEELVKKIDLSAYDEITGKASGAHYLTNDGIVYCSHNK